jgi:hypothetical protein
VLALFFMFGPAAIGAVVARRLLIAERTPTGRVGATNEVVIVCLALLSAWLGTSISFNTWGT